MPKTLIPDADLDPEDNIPDEPFEKPDAVVPIAPPVATDEDAEEETYEIDASLETEFMEYVKSVKNVLPNLTRISMPGSDSHVFNFKDGDSSWTDSEFEGVILTVRAERTYYDVPFKRGSKRPPACQSPDGDIGVGDNGEGWDKRECSDCPKAQFGEKGENPLCNERRRVYMMTATESLPIEFRVTPSGLSVLRRYFQQMGKKRGQSMTSVVTRCSLVRVEDTSKLQLQMVKPLKQSVVDAMTRIRTVLEPQLDEREVNTFKRLETKENVDEGEDA